MPSKNPRIEASIHLVVLFIGFSLCHRHRAAGECVEQLTLFGSAGLFPPQTFAKQVTNTLAD